MTGYCPCAKCCGDWSATGRTASGQVPRAGLTVAAPRNVPLGTRVRIAGLGWRTVQDRTARRYEGRWDVFFSSHAEAARFGKRTLKISR